MGFELQTLTAFVAVDPANGDEGIIGRTLPNGVMMPMIGADQARIESLKPEAAQIAKMTGQTVRMIRFTGREILEELEP